MRGQARRLALLSGVLLVVALPVGAATPVSPAPSQGDGDARAVAAFHAGDGPAVPCAPIDGAAQPYARGGCVLRLFSNKIDVWSRTALGRLPFSYDCSFSFELHVAADGSTVMDRLLFGGTQGGCGDIRPCEPNALEPSMYDRRNLAPADHLPWHGRLVSLGGGRFVNRAKICLDTCAGRFDGTLELLLERRGGRWAVRADRAPVGTTGMELDGSWDVQGESPDLRPGPATAKRGTERRRAMGAVTALYAALRARDAGRVCALLMFPQEISTPAGIEPPRGQTCVAMYRQVLADSGRRGLLGAGLAVRVDSAAVHGGRAVAQVSAGSGGTPVKLERQQGAWRVERIDWTPED